MRRSHLLLLVVLLALAAWWIGSGWGDRGRRAEAPEGAGASVAPAALDAAPAAAAAAAPATDAPGVERAEAEVGGVEREAAAGAARTFRVKVLDAADGEPVPHAEVLLLVLDAATQGPFRALMTESEDAERAFDELGTVHPAGADGIAEVPVPPTACRLGARKDEAFGIAGGVDHTNLPEVLEIRIAPSIHVRVHVEDETGAALAGVTVAFVSGDGMRVNARTEAVTDAGGDAELRHLETAINDYTRTQRSRIVAMLPLPQLPGSDFRLDAPPRDVVRIVVPSCGSAVVEVLDLAGERVGDGIPVSLQRAFTDEERAAWIKQYGIEPGISMRAQLGTSVVSTERGLARFPHVPVGGRLECFASPDRSMIQVSVEADGPLRPGEEVRIVLQQTEAHPVLTGRLVTAAGIPVGKVELRGTYWRGWPERAGTREGGVILRLDEESRFRHVLDEVSVPPGIARILCIHRALDGNSRIQSAWIFVPEQVPAEGFDAGDVVLGGPLMVAGRVERPDGSPVANARIHPRFRLAPPDEPDDGMTFRVNAFQWRSGPDGRFALEGTLPGTRHQLEVWPEGGKALYVPFVPGEPDLRVIVQESGEIRGRLLLDEGILGTHFSVDFGRTSPQVADEMHSAMAMPDALSGEFSSQAVAIGTWRVGVRFRGTGEYVAMIDGVEVRPDGPADDPRLQVDLRGKVFRHRITVLDADGGHPEQLTLSLEGADGWTFGGASNPADFCITARVLHGFVGAKGLGQAEFHSSGEEIVVRLGRGIPVRFAWTGDGPEVAEEGFSLTMTGNADPASGRPEVWMFGEWFDPGRAPEVVVPAAGTYRVRLQVRCDPPPGKEWPKSAALRFGDGEYLEVEIAAGDAERSIPIEITADMVREARERVARGER